MGSTSYSSTSIQGNETQPAVVNPTTHSHSEFFEEDKESSGEE